ncbi:hypothetical protein B0A52_00401 [Exophiala mesophila]|uniref:Spindle pole body component n=1 Tax=Exophiala mesophila TaxID=212818 RepID=A0A438NJY4_EXOME|nr:hypothetical protein B0A52_00401 [Exophiala mesophila]
MSLQTEIDAFTSDILTEIPALDIKSSPIWEGFRFNSSIESGVFRLNELKAHDLPILKSDVFQLAIQDVPLPDLSTPPSTTPSESSGEELGQGGPDKNEEDQLANLWSLPDVVNRRSEPRLVSWENFLDEAHEEPGSAYLSEQEPRAFSAVLASVEHAGTSRIVRPDVILDAVFELVMGRGSGLFGWNEKTTTFDLLWDNMTALGYSKALLHNSISIFVKIGVYSRRLLALFQDMDLGGISLQPARLALLSAARSTLYVVHQYLEGLRVETRSLLQLHATISKVSDITMVLWTLCNETSTCQSDAMPGVVLQEALKASATHPGIVPILRLIFNQTLRPRLIELGNEIGLDDKLPSAETLDESDGNIESTWEILLPPDVCQLASQAKHSLQLLRIYARDSALCLGLQNTSQLEMWLQPVHTWSDIGRLQDVCNSYETTMKAVLRSPATNQPVASCVDEDNAGQQMQNGPFQLDLNLFQSTTCLNRLSSTSDPYHDIVTDYLTDEHTKTPGALELDFRDSLVFSLKPVISTQHRLVSFAVLDLLFESHNVYSHIKLQMDVHMFRNADFAQRLGMALFDPDQGSGEGRRREGGSTGLRLQDRGTWPPSSSELRVVLMGVLSDSLASSSSPRDQAHYETLSFAIRELTYEELERCRKVDSVHALDFLRLQYRPPSPVLETVLTVPILDKYDRIFQHLLRLLRVHSVTQRLLRDNFHSKDKAQYQMADQRLIAQMHQFVTALADYTHNFAIYSAWTKLSSTLQTVHSHIRNRNYERTLEMVKSHDYLRAVHERTLDTILHSLTLKTKQSECVWRLYEVFDVILQFAASRRKQDMSSMANDELGIGNETPTKRFDEDFRTKVVRFMEVLRQQAQTAEESGDTWGEFVAESHDQDGRVNLLQMLLLHLDMSGYWNRVR